MRNTQEVFENFELILTSELSRFFFFSFFFFTQNRTEQISFENFESDRLEFTLTRNINASIFAKYYYWCECDVALKKINLEFGSITKRAAWSLDGDAFWW